MKQNKWTIIAGLFGPSLLGLCAATLLSGCGGDSTPSHLQGARPGADRTAPVLKALPPPDSGRPHESGVAPADETQGGAAIGSTVRTEGGQKAQKEEADKQAAERSRKDRERVQRAAEARKAAPPVEQAPSPSPPPSPPSPSND